jgi:N-acyl-D-aspartate/D-glutamate deacylase
VSDLLIQGGMLIDGTGSAALPADVRVRAGRIVELAPELQPVDEPCIDAGGAFVAPGFIDAHTHYDPALFWDPRCDPMPLHGVTTLVIGNCSLSLAPLPAEHRADLIGAFSYIEDIPPLAFEHGVPWSWESWAEYGQALGGVAVNAVGLVGHSALRLAVLGEQAWERAATPEERERLAALLGDCLDAGAFGLSTSLADVDAQGRPVPSRRADDDELRALAHVMAARGRGMLEFVPLIDTHEGRLAGVERIHSVFGAAGIRASWTGFAPGSAAHTAEILEQARRTQSEGAGVWPQISPRAPDVRICLDQTIAFSFIPAWHKLVQADPAEKRRMLADSWWRGKARDHWDRRSTPFFPTHASAYPLVWLRVAQTDALPRGFDELIAAHGGHPSDVLADWILENDLDVEILKKAPDRTDANAALLCDPAVLVGSSDAGAHCQSFCGAGDTTLLLERYVRERRDLPIEAAVRRLTSEVADHFGIPERGRLQVGAVADLVVFDLERLRWMDDELVADLPGGGSRLRREAAGYRATIVGGVPTQLEGKPTGHTPGGLLPSG